MAVHQLYREPPAPESPDPTLNHVASSSPKLNSGGWTAAAFILATEAAERLAFYSIAGNLVTYLLYELHEPLPKSVTLVTNWIGAAYVLGIPGAFIADSYLGRLCTIVIHSIAYIFGMVLMTLSATIRSLRPSSCDLVTNVNCEPASASQLGFLYAGLYMIAIGTGGIKACVSPLGADQFNEADVRESHTKASFFNWFFFSVNIGALFAFTIIVYIQDNVGWGLGFGIPAAGMVISLILLLSGMRRYRRKPPSGSPLTRFVQVMVAAIRNWTVEVSTDEHQLYERKVEASAIAGVSKLGHTKNFRFLDKAAVCANIERDNDNRWKLCSVTQVEELKLFLRILPIIGTTLFLWTGYSQFVTFFVRQGTTLDRRLGAHFQIPAASLPIFSVLNALVVLPLYDRIVVPFVEKYISHSKRGFTPLQRMGFGLCASVFSMIAAALVERRRLTVIQDHQLQDQPGLTIPMSIFWLIPQYFLVGLAEIFTYVGQLEFFYDEVSDGMRSLSTSLFISELGIGSWISSLLVTIVRVATGKEDGWIQDNINRSRIDKFYWLLAALSGINFFLFVVTATFYRYKKQNQLTTIVVDHEYNGIQRSRGDHEPVRPEIRA